jgi:hypothetical protein
MQTRVAGEESMPGEVRVTNEGGIVCAVYLGQMNPRLLDESNGVIRSLLAHTQARRILYDTLHMAEPTMDLALQMKRFDAELRGSVDRAATLVPAAATAFMAKIAFAFTKSHKVFYRDREAALAWLGG